MVLFEILTDSFLKYKILEKEFKVITWFFLLNSLIVSIFSLDSINIHGTLSLAFKIQPTVYIYGAFGASPEALLHTNYTLKKLIHPRYIIKKISPKEVIQGTWASHATLFVMPGGSDLPYCKALNGEGNRHIQEFVRKGGAYLGICAGAYYGSGRVVFAFNTSLEITGERELAFFPGTIEGPFLEPYVYRSNAGAKATQIHWQGSDSPFAHYKTFTSFYNGGGYFIDPQAYPHVTVLASYGATPQPKAAIIEASVGKGRVILTGVHCEYEPTLLNPKDELLLPIRKILIATNQDRLALMGHLLNRLGIETVHL